MPDEQRAYPLQRRLSRLYSRRLLAIIDTYCSAVSEIDEIHRIETLELDLGEIPLDAFEETLIERFEEAFRRQLAEAVRHQQPPASNGRSVKTRSRLELFEYFVETGTVPWWTDPADPTLLDECVAWLAGTASASLKTLTADLLTHEPYLKRIIHHLSDSTLLTLAGLFSETLLPVLGPLHADLTTLFGRADALRALPLHRLRYALWATILLAVSPLGTPSAQRAGFVETILLQVAVRCGIRYTDLLDALVEAGRRLSRTGYRFKSTLPEALTTLHEASTPSAAEPGVPPTASPPAATTAAPPSPEEAYPDAAATAETQRLVPSPSATRKAGPPAKPPVSESTEAETPTKPPGSEVAETEAPVSRPPIAEAAEAPVSRAPIAEATATPLPEETPAETTETDRPPSSLPAPSETAASDRTVLFPSADETTQAGSPAQPPASEPTEIETPSPEAAKAPATSPDEAARKPGDVPPRRKRYGRHTFSAVEELYIGNAGLVILWPFLGQFFEQLGLLEERQFRDEVARHRAVGLLQFLADGRPEPPPEYLLPLNKVLCGVDVEEVFDFGPPFTDAEIEESAALLQAVIAHAPVLGNMAVPGFRGTFLLRKGQLSTRDGVWLLRVERETYDVVLDRFPWNVNIVKLPWMTAMMQVEW